MFILVFNIPFAISRNLVIFSVRFLRSQFTIKTYDLSRIINQLKVGKVLLCNLGQMKNSLGVACEKRL
jgi:hypothetical protein